MSKSGATLAAVAVHGLTVSGAGIALLALIAVSDGRIGSALIWMAVGLAIDGLDGPLARRLRVAERCPALDGSLLDNLVDYASYVLVPAFLIHRAVPLPAALAPALPIAICFASAFQFAQTEAKADDGSFRGFPSYWNLVAFYLLLLDWPAWANGVAIGTLCGLVFVPVHYAHPVRSVPFRRLTLGLTGVWAVGLIWSLLRYPEPDRQVVRLSLLYVVYYFGLSLWLTRMRIERLKTRRSR